MAAQASRDVREDFVAVLEFDAERRARVDLLDRAEHLDHRLFRRLVDPFDPLRGRFAALGRTSRRARYDCTNRYDFTPSVTNAGSRGLQADEFFTPAPGRPRARAAFRRASGPTPRRRRARSAAPPRG